MSKPGILGVVGVAGFQVSRFPWWCSPCRLCKESLVFNFGPFDTLSDSLDPVSDSLLIMLRILGKIKRGPKVSREFYIAYVSRSTNRRYDIAYVILYDSIWAQICACVVNIFIIAHLYKCITCIRMIIMFIAHVHVLVHEFIHHVCKVHTIRCTCDEDDDIQCVFYTQSINLYDLCISVLRRGHISLQLSNVAPS